MQCTALYILNKHNAEVVRSFVQALNTHSLHKQTVNQSVLDTQTDSKSGSLDRQHLLPCTPTCTYVHTILCSSVFLRGIHITPTESRSHRRLCVCALTDSQYYVFPPTNIGFLVTNQHNPITDKRTMHSAVQNRIANTGQGIQTTPILQFRMGRETEEEI